MGKNCTTLHRTWKRYKRWKFGLENGYISLFFFLLLFFFFSLHFYLELYELCRASGVEQAIPRLCKNSLRNTKSTRRLSTYFHDFLIGFYLQICRKCGAKNAIRATNCRKRACGHSTDLRDRHGMHVRFSKKK